MDYVTALYDQNSTVEGNTETPYGLKQRIGNYITRISDKLRPYNTIITAALVTFNLLVTLGLYV